MKNSACQHRDYRRNTLSLSRENRGEGHCSHCGQTSPIARTQALLVEERCILYV